jgi:hypothetical protein
MSLDKERHTNPVTNIIQTNQLYMREYLKRMVGPEGVYEAIRKSNKKLVEAHKDVYGRQTYCWNGEFRNWVWDYGKYRIYVSNQRGISIEVDPQFTASDTMVMLRDYWSKFGV